MLHGERLKWDLHPRIRLTDTTYLNGNTLEYKLYTNYYQQLDSIKCL
jgi:hypothetical protein